MSNDTSKPSTASQPAAPKRVLKRQPDEADNDYNFRCGLFSSIINRLSISRDNNPYDDTWWWKNISDFNYEYLGRSIEGITVDSTPCCAWNRIQCIVWIKLFLQQRVWLPASSATAVACKFEGTGELLVRLEKQEWVEMCSSTHIGLSIWLRMEDLKSKRLLGSEDKKTTAEMEERDVDKGEDSDLPDYIDVTQERDNGNHYDSFHEL